MTHRSIRKRAFLRSFFHTERYQTFIQTTPCQVTVSLYTRQQWTDERLAARTIHLVYIQHLPSSGILMEGPPIEIHVDPAATPTACHTPANVRIPKDT